MTLPVPTRTLAATLLLAALTAAAPPATAPADQAAALRQWLKQLADQDPQVRERARLSLMGIGSPQLPQLRDAVVEARPLAPSQVAELPTIVGHVFLTGEQDEPAAAGSGFLGIMTQATSEIVPAPGVRAEGMPVGVTVDTRVPGYCGYRALQDGDLIVRVRSDKGGIDFRNAEEFTKAIASHRAGETVKLDVVRQGRQVEVAVELDRKPKWAEARLAVPEYLGQRQRRAADYWDRAFAPLLDDSSR